jgi:calcineurin-like phosphoesterase family protein
MEPVYAIYVDRSASAALPVVRTGFPWKEYAVIEQSGGDPASEFRSDLDKRRVSSPLGGCCVLTCRPSDYRGKFAANDVLDMSGMDSGKIPDSIRFVLSGSRTSRPGDVDLVFFCSDLHFNHVNIVRYCSRPWNSGVCATGELAVTDDDVRRMNDELVSNWNSVVPKGATVWFLGDFCLGKDQRTAIPEFVSRLNGRISIVLGNHDRHSMKFYYDAGFKAVYDRPVVWNSCFILSHAPV